MSSAKRLRGVGVAGQCLNHGFDPSSFDDDLQCANCRQCIPFLAEYVELSPCISSVCMKCFVDLHASRGMDLFRGIIVSSHHIIGAEKSHQLTLSHLFSQDYFVNFLKLKLQGEILESHVTGSTGKKVKGHCSFIYVHEDGEWKINHHHSSVILEGIMVTAKSITEKELRGRRNIPQG
ncbi:hypothetical protein ACHAWF_003222, partial [Thalassiosira exigua]